MKPNRLLPVWFAWIELLRYDLVNTIWGFRSVRASLGNLRPSMRVRPLGVESACSAVNRAMSFYWKPVLCLQRSIVTARLARMLGVPAEVVIGYRADPFLSHAWVEVAGDAVNDSSDYQTRLRVLTRI